MNIRTLIGASLILTTAVLTHPARASVPGAAAVAWHPGFVIRAEDRFDPAIQRLMAEHSLRSLPLERGRLYYLYPIGIAPRLEGMQIRYLETLLDKQAAKEEEAAAQAEADGGSDSEKE